jgi:DNA transposition AAA+ family ATPase
MLREQKELIHSSLIEALGNKQTNKSIAIGAGISDAMVSLVRDPSKWDNYSNGNPIPDRIWIALQSYLKVGVTSIQTTQYLEIFHALTWAKVHSGVGIIDGRTGSSKTHTLGDFQLKYPHACYTIKCARDFTPKSFIFEIAKKIGADTNGTQYDIRCNIIVSLAQETGNKPILIFDEAECLSDRNYDVIKKIYDELENRVAIVLVGANKYWSWLKTRAKKLDNCGKCFPQIVSRFGANVTTLSDISYEDVKMVCEHFGVTQKEEVQRYWQTCEDYRPLFGQLKKKIREKELGLS